MPRYWRTSFACSRLGWQVSLTDMETMKESINAAITDFATWLIESGQLDAEACKVVASFALDYMGDDNV